MIYIKFRLNLFILLFCYLADFIGLPNSASAQSFQQNANDSALFSEAEEFLLHYEYDSLFTFFLQAGVDEEINGRYLHSFRYLHIARQIAEHKKNMVEAATVFINLGIVWFDINNDSKAIENNNKALILAKNCSDTLLQIKALNNIGNVYLTHKNNADTALFYFSKAYDLSDKINYYDGIHAIGGNITQIYLLKNEFDKADSLLIHLMASDSSISYYYFIEAMIEKNRMNYRRSIYACEKALLLSNEPEFILAVYSEMAEIAYLMEDYQRAYMYLHYKTNLNDSIHDISLKKNIVELEEKYETEKRLLEIARLENSLLANQKRSQRFRFILMLISLLLLLALSYVYFLRKNAKHKLRLMTSEAESKTALSFIEGEEAERKRLAHELHDGLVGSITGLRLQLYTKQLQANTTEAESLNLVMQQLDALAGETRNISHKLYPVLLEQQGLQIALKEYFKAFLPGTGALHLDIKLSGENFRYDLLIEKMVFHIIQELFNNVIKHSKANEAIVSVDTTREQIHCRLIDKGIGFDVAANRHGQGLFSIQERVERVGGTLTINSELGMGTEIGFSIPAKSIKLQNDENFN